MASGSAIQFIQSFPACVYIFSLPISLFALLHVFQKHIKEKL